MRAVTAEVLCVTEHSQLETYVEGEFKLDCTTDNDWTRFVCSLKVFHYATQKIEEVLVTDPYSRCLSADGKRSMFVDLDQDTSLMPAGWQQHASPAINGTHTSTGIWVMIEHSLISNFCVCLSLNCAPLPPSKSTPAGAGLAESVIMNPEQTCFP